MVSTFIQLDLNRQIPILLIFVKVRTRQRIRREEGGDRCSALERDLDEETGTTTTSTTTTPSTSTTTKTPTASPIRDDVEVALVVFPILVAGEELHPCDFKIIVQFLSSFIAFAFAWTRIGPLVVLLSQKEKDQDTAQKSTQEGQRTKAS